MAIIAHHTHTHTRTHTETPLWQKAFPLSWHTEFAHLHTPQDLILLLVNILMPKNFIDNPVENIKNQKG